MSVLPVGAARYILGRELGRGGSGRVVEAKDQQFDRVVAVKRLEGELDEPAWKRFVDEALVTGGLEHPGIPTVYERGVDDDGVPFYVMKKIQGRTLGDAITAAATLQERMALLPIVVRAAHTLAYAHERGIVHRDVKPHNIIVGDHGETTVIDWGIAKVLSGDSSMPRTPDETLVGTVVGTPAYMSPEQAEGRIDELDRRTDVFALGSLLYYVLSGRAPYSSASPKESLEHAALARRPLLKELVADAPSELIEICDKAMARLPDGRFRSATELARALEDFERRAIVGVPRSVRWLAQGGIAMALLTTCGITLAINLSLTPRFHGDPAPGMPQYGLAATVGLALAAIELATKGRYVLHPVGIALAAVTFLMSLATGLVAFVNLARVPRAEALADAAAYHRWAIETIARASQAIPPAATLAAVQLLVWALVRRWSLLRVTPRA